MPIEAWASFVREVRYVAGQIHQLRKLCNRGELRADIGPAAKKIFVAGAYARN
jgi:hypothetical protein